MGFDACLSIAAGNPFAWIDIDAFPVFFAVAARVVGACLVCARVDVHASQVYAFLFVCAQRARICRRIYTGLGRRVADFAVGAFRARIFNRLVLADAVFAGLVSAAFGTRIVDWLVLAGAVFADLVGAAFVARIADVFGLAFAVDAFFRVCANAVAAFVL